MFHLDDPEEMTPDERLQEIAGILAIGYLRLKKQTPCLANIASGEQQEAGSHIPVIE